jgi:protein disulfide-isomerase A6
VSSYPTLKWFAAGKKEAVPYEGARSEQAFIDFINKEVGTYRAVGGRLTAAGGTVAALDAVIQKIYDAGGDIATKADELVKAAKGESAPFAAYYAKVAEKVKKNSGYVEKELSRLEGILKKGGLAPQKIDDLTSRSNILRKFKITKSDEKSEL